VRLGMRKTLQLLPLKRESAVDGVNCLLCPPALGDLVRLGHCCEVRFKDVAEGEVTTNGGSWVPVQDQVGEVVELDDEGDFRLRRLRCGSESSWVTRECFVRHLPTSPGAAIQRGTDDEKPHRQALLALNGTEQTLIHLARAFIANPDVLVMERPFALFEDMDMKMQLLETLKEHVENRGLCLSRSRLHHRRPKTVFFSTDDERFVDFADILWTIEGTNIRSSVPERRRRSSLGSLDMPVEPPEPPLGTPVPKERQQRQRQQQSRNQNQNQQGTAEEEEVEREQEEDLGIRGVRTPRREEEEDARSVRSNNSVSSDWSHDFFPLIMPEPDAFL